MTEEAWLGLCHGSFIASRVLVKEEPRLSGSLSPVPYTEHPFIARVEWEKLLSALDGSDALLRIQCVGTLLTDEERRQIHDRAGQYLNSQTTPFSWQEETARTCAASWAKLAAASHSPFGLCTLLVQGDPGSVAAVSARLKGSLRRENGLPIPLRTFEVTDLLTNLGENAPWRLPAALRDPLEGSRLSLLLTPAEVGTLMALPSADGRRFTGLAANPFSLLSDTSQPLPEEYTFPSEESIHLGELTDGRPLYLPVRNLATSAILPGQSGSGKTRCARSIVEGLSHLGIPAIILTPAQDFRATAVHCAMRILPVNAPEGAFLLNPFRVPYDVPLADYRSHLTRALQAGLALPDPLPSLFRQTVSSVFARYNWRDSTEGGCGEPFGLTEFIQEYHRLLQSGSLYDSDVSGNLRSGGANRAAYLNDLGTTSRCLDSFDPGELLQGGGSLIEMDADPQQAMMLTCFLLVQLHCHIKACHNAFDRRPLKALIVIDEAHRLLADEYAVTEEGRNSSASVQQLVLDFITEMRKYGVGCLLCDQSLTRLPSAILDAVNTKILFGLSGREALEAARAIGMEEHRARALAHLAPREALLMGIGVPAAGFTTRPCGNGDLEDEEVRRYMEENWPAEPCRYRPYRACSHCPGCEEACDVEVRELADCFSRRILACPREPLTPLSLDKLVLAVPNILSRWGYDDLRLSRCTAIHLLSQLARSTGLSPASSPSSLIALMTHRDKKGGLYEER